MPSSDHQGKSSLAHRVSSLRNHRQNPKAFPLSRWKENLKASCLENARKRRREMLMKKRFGGYSSDSRSTGTSAEDVLMEALMDHSTSKMTSNTGSLNPESIGISCEDGEEVDSCHEELATKPSNRNDRLPDWHDLTDDDLYELLLEIEEELQVDDEVLLEEVLEEERTSLEYQVNEYEDWGCDMHQEERVVCPLCTAGYLLLSSTGDICCDDEYCPMRVRPFDSRNPLQAFKDDLGGLFEEHCKCCSDQLVFTACTNQKGLKILASCNSCNLHREF